MYFETAEEYTAEIALVQASIRRTLQSQKYSISSSTTGRESQRVDLESLRTYLKELQEERSNVTGSACKRILAKPGRRYA